MSASGLAFEADPHFKATTTTLNRWWLAVGHSRQKA